jgi:hypothetical protein
MAAYGRLSLIQEGRRAAGPFSSPPAVRSYTVFGIQQEMQVLHFLEKKRQSSC